MKTRASYKILALTEESPRRLNVEVQQVSGRMIDLLWGFEAMSFPRSRVEFVGDPIAFLLR